MKAVVTINKDGEPVVLNQHGVIKGNNVIKYLSRIDEGSYIKVGSQKIFYTRKIVKNDIIYTNIITKDEVKVVNYKKCFKELHKLYLNNKLQFDKDKKIMTLATLGIPIITGIGIGAMVMLGGNNENTLTNEEKEVIELELKDDKEDISLSEDTGIIESPNVNGYESFNEYETTVEMPEPVVLETDIAPVVDTERDKQLEPYLDIIKARSERWGINFNLFYDICCQEYGGEGTNLCHVVFDSWEDEIITAHNFETGVDEKIVLTRNPGKYVNQQIQTISPEELTIPEVNVSIGAIILQYTARKFNGNIGLSVQAYNNGIYATYDTVAITAENLGVTAEDIINDQTNLEWMNYTDHIAKGDSKYCYKVFGRVFPDQTTNDIYDIKYIDQDGNIAQSDEMVVKLGR